MECIIIKEASLVAKLPTEKTKHFLGNEELPVPFKIQIARYDGDSGFYLFYLDESGNELTDTYHDTLEAAMEQAEWEFEVKVEDWIDTGKIGS